MIDGAAASNSNESGTLDRWSARKIRPIVMFYVVAVFAVFIALSYFVFHSSKAVRVLVIAAVGAVVAMVPGVAERLEYRVTATGIEKRTVKTNKPREFKLVFRWDELSHVVPMRHGFNYYKTLNETNPLRRFWKAQISDQFSGEVHVEKEDLGRVLEIVEQRGITIS